jgi:hypothetical protein
VSDAKVNLGRARQMAKGMNVYVLWIRLTSRALAI